MKVAVSGKGGTGKTTIARLERRPTAVACVRSGVGVDWSPQALAISLWRDGPDRRARALAEASALGASWAMCWQPADYEIGHWDGLRLRQAARRRAREDAR